ncbi:TolC family outer membrane protein [Spongiibacter sp. KMU-158]|uniref:TolC family outer membrane protein n=1 Tax=Spongiibacter pelagi TaxID=2760804 RepID=A0A927GV42_9GAMM|nr:TolC family outer membrane protein [Spongiibacter pelagi]MBD2857492.1 TolC family outer membrane protein [Spongiibacter pelagi]
MLIKRHLLATAILGTTLFAGASHADTLLDVYELAVKNDPQLKAAEATYRANSEAENLSRAALLPQISGQAYIQQLDSTANSKTVTVTSGAFGSTSTSIIDQETKSDTDTTGYAISLNQALFDLPAWFNFKAGKKLNEQAEAQLAYDQQSLIVRVAEAYFNVLRAQENLNASLSEERAGKRQLEQTQQRFDVGLIAITDVHEARAVYDGIVAQRLGFEGQLAIAQENLSILTGQNHNQLWNLKASFPVTLPAPENRAEWVDFALQNNNQLKVALAGSDAAYQSAKSKKMEHLPKISGSFSYSNDETDGTRTFAPQGFASVPPESDSESEVLKFTLSMPLFAGGAVSASRRQALGNYHAAQSQLQLTQRQVVTGTRAQHIAVSTDVQTVKARQLNTVSARSALDATEAGYEVGTRNIVEVLDAQRRLFAALRDYSNSRYDYVIDVLKLKLNAGTLSPNDIIELNKWLEAEKIKQG